MVDYRKISQSEEEKEPEESECHPHNFVTGSYQDHKEEILQSLRRIEGQVRGVQKMVQEERYCVDVLDQVAAARMALARVAMAILEDHTRGCVTQALKEEDKQDEIIKELMAIIKRFT